MLKSLGLLFLILSVLTGCQNISKEELEALNARAEQLQVKAEALEEEQMALQMEQKALEEENETLKTDIEALSQQVQVEQSKGDLKVTMQQEVLFNLGSFGLSQNGAVVLKQVADVLANLDENKRINIVGHTDDLPVHKKWRDKFVDNWDLSARRAAEVARYFIWGHGIAPERIAVVGRAHTQPVASNDSEENRAMNRRIELFIVTE